MVAAGFSLRSSMSIREKKHRLDRELYRGIVSVSFTLCVQDKKAVFIDPAIVRSFIDILARITEPTSCIAPVYCFMPDHLHVLLRGTSCDSDLWKTLVAYKQRTGFWLTTNRPAIKWQKDFYDHVIRDHESLGVQVRYILDNPVRKGLADCWQDYPHKGSIGCTLEDVLSGVM